MNCHRHSGLGTIEGTVSIPPITGRYLFQPRHLAQDEAALPYLANAHSNRDPYTEATLARSIREGLDSTGRPLSDLMPRFALNDADMTALIRYLRSLDVSSVPGVTPTVLHFASIVTPDADPAKRSGMVDVLEHYFAEKNMFPLKPSERMRSSGKTLYAKSMYHANRHWQLHVWDLKGPPASWRKQLEQHLAAEPVMAAGDECDGLGDEGEIHRLVLGACERKREIPAKVVLAELLERRFELGDAPRRGRHLPCGGQRHGVQENV